MTTTQELLDKFAANTGILIVLTDECDFDQAIDTVKSAKQTSLQHLERSFNELLEGLYLQVHGPRYQHDCNACVFLTRHDEYDLYFCPHEPTVVARYGDQGPEYTSGLTAAKITDDTNHPLSRALLRARQLGFIGADDTVASQENIDALKREMTKSIVLS